MMTSRSASHYPTCCESSALRSGRSHRRKSSSLLIASIKQECLILDIAMPGMTGPELQQELKNRGQTIPIIFITAQRDETIRSLVLGAGCYGMSVQAIQRDGAE